jgi:hypothetical protein
LYKQINRIWYKDLQNLLAAKLLEGYWSGTEYGKWLRKAQGCNRCDLPGASTKQDQTLRLDPERQLMRSPFVSLWGRPLMAS